MHLTWLSTCHNTVLHHLQFKNTNCPGNVQDIPFESKNDFPLPCSKSLSTGDELMLKNIERQFRRDDQPSDVASSYGESCQSCLRAPRCHGRGLVSGFWMHAWSPWDVDQHKRGFSGQIRVYLDDVCNSRIW